MRVYRQNKTESTKLDEKLDHLERAQIQKMIAIREDIKLLRQTSREIRKVQEEMEISQMRRRFFANNGYALISDKINMNELVRRTDMMTNKPMGATIPLLCEETRQTKDDLEEDGVRKNEKYSIHGLDLTFGESSTKGKMDGFKFRKIVPPLEGRKIEEVYKEMKEHGRRKLNVRDLEHLHVRNEETETTVNSERELKGNVAMHVGDKSERQDQYKMRKMANSFENLWDDRTGDKILSQKEIIEFGGSKNKIEAKPIVSGKGKSKKVTNKGNKEKEWSIHHRNTRPLSCPPKTYTRNSAISPRSRESAARSATGGNKKQSRKAWVDNCKRERCEEKERIERRRKSWEDNLENDRDRSSPIGQRKISSAQVIEGGNRMRKISHGYEVEKEIVYDARPKDAMTSGYATLQMTIGKNSATVHIAKFKKEILKNEQDTERARATKTFELEQKRIQRIRQKIELQDY